MMWCVDFFMFEKPTGAHVLRSAPQLIHTPANKPSRAVTRILSGYPHGGVYCQSGNPHIVFASSLPCVVILTGYVRFTSVVTLDFFDTPALPRFYGE